MLSCMVSKVFCSSGGGVERPPSHGELGLAAGRVLEAEGREHLQRPGGAAGMARDAALLVRKRIDEDQLLLRHDLAIGEQAPHGAAVGRLHAVVIGAADAQIHFRGDHGEALRAPPMLHALRIGEAFPQQIARRIEHARDDEVFVRLLSPGHERSSTRLLTLTAARSPSSRRRTCRRACRSAARRRSCSSALSPGRPRRARRTVCRLRPRPWP